MHFSLKILAALAFGAGALGVAAASAHDDYRRSARAQDCRLDHDHRAHDARYYDHHPADRYSRAGPYRGARVSLTVSSGRYDRRDSRYTHGYGERYRSSRPVHREVYDTRYRAHIVLVERVTQTRRGRHLTCTVSARGPQAHRVPHRRLKRIAARECAPRARIVVRT